MMSSMVQVFSLSSSTASISLSMDACEGLLDKMVYHSGKKGKQVMGWGANFSSIEVECTV